MFKTVEGVFRNGRIELFEVPEDLQEARVYVTFVPPKNLIDLRERGMDEQQAADLRWRLQTVAEDWERPEMDVYDEV